MTWIDNRYFRPILIRTYQLCFHEERPEHEPLAIAHISVELCVDFREWNKLKSKSREDHELIIGSSLFLLLFSFSNYKTNFYDYFTSINNALTHCIRLCAAF